MKILDNHHHYYHRYWKVLLLSLFFVSAFCASEKGCENTSHACIVTAAPSNPVIGTLNVGIYEEVCFTLSPPVVDSELAVTLESEYPLCLRVDNQVCGCTAGTNGTVTVSVIIDINRIQTISTMISPSSTSSRNSSYELSWLYRPLSPCCSTNFNNGGCYSNLVSDCVCERLPECCSDVWSEQCVKGVEKYGCGDCNSGSCCYPHLSGGCVTREITNCVCKENPLCCSVEWSLDCVQLVDSCAPQFCPTEMPRFNQTTSCYYPHNEPGCSNSDAADCVCKVDPFCCNVYWSVECVQQLIAFNWPKDHLCPI